MFDIGFAELLIIGIVALIVIGPERLPDAIRTASAWLNRIRRGFNDIKQEVQQELHNDAVMKDLRSLRETGEELRKETKALSSDLASGLNVPEMSSGTSTDAVPFSDTSASESTDSIENADKKPGE